MKINFSASRLIKIMICLGSLSFSGLSFGGECDYSTQVVVVNEDFKLNIQCEYKNTFIIKSSDVVFDCNGATLNGANKLEYGIRVDSAGKTLKNVAIKNCFIRNYAKTGIFLGWQKADDEKLNYSADKIYKVTPSGVVIENSLIDNSGRVGLYVDDYVTNTIIKNVEISNSGDVGVYFEFNSSNNVLEDSRILNNGYIYNREGVAIDSSEKNKIINNKFIGNKEGGVFIYKNCWEHHDTNPHSVKRTMSADKNLIRGNYISGGAVGVWIASRQSKNLKGMHCGEPSYHNGIYYKDYAKDNVIDGNIIESVSRGIIVEDDNNFILNNTFNAVDVAVRVGSKPREEYLSLPVSGVRVSGNIFNNVRKKIEIFGSAEVKEDVK